MGEYGWIELTRRRINWWWSEIFLTMRFASESDYGLFLWQAEIFKLDRIVFVFQQLRIFFRVQVTNWQWSSRFFLWQTQHFKAEFGNSAVGTHVFNLVKSIWQPSCVSSWGDRFTCFNNLALALDSLDHHVEAEVRGHMLGTWLGLVQMAHNYSKLSSIDINRYWSCSML